MTVKILKPEYVEEYRQRFPEHNKVYVDPGTPDYWWEEVSDPCPRCVAHDAKMKDVEGGARIIHEVEFSTDYDSASDNEREMCERIFRNITAWLLEAP